MGTSSEIGVRSETSPLELIVTSPPGPEFDLMLPENLERQHIAPDGSAVPNPNYLLFDDLVLLSALQREHRTLVEVIQAVTGEEGHLTWHQLLVETLGLADARREAIAATLDLEVALYQRGAADLSAGRTSLERLDAPRLAWAFVSGRDPFDKKPIFTWPIPNAMFARDLAAVAGKALIATYAAEPARVREVVLTRIILKHHRRFRDLDRIDIGDEGKFVPGVTLEGGDIQVLDPRVAVIGIGIRTSRLGAERLARELLHREFEVVLGVELPRSRGAMHLDTLMTRIDNDHALSTRRS